MLTDKLRGEAAESDREGKGLPCGQRLKKSKLKHLYKSIVPLVP